MKAMGLFGLTIPEEYGGLGLTMEEEVRGDDELGRTSPAFRSVIGTTVGIGSQGIVMDGTPEQKAAVPAPLASGELIASFALTEPDAGRTPRRCAPRPIRRTATTTSSTAASATSPTRRRPACSR
jgi:acyl-CoA dehydrogenase